MSFTYFDTKDNKVQQDTSHVEINSIVNNSLKNGKPKEEVEIFSKMVWGKDVSNYGTKVDTVRKDVMKIADAADNGDTKAKAEINSIVTVTLQQPLMQRLQINNMLGNTTVVPYDAALRYEFYQIQGELSRDQAASGSFVTPTVKKMTDYAETHTASGGLAIDYREMASGAIDGFARAAEQVVTSIFNQVTAFNFTTLHNGIVNATTMKNYAAGITKSSVDAVLLKARRFGNVTIMGDYSAVSKLNGLSGFGTVGTAFVPTNATWTYSDATMDEIRRTGLVKNYNGTTVIEVPNTYNLTELNTAGDFFKPYLNTTDMWFVPQGQLTPLNIVYRGGLTTMTGTNINTREEITVWDLCHGAKVFAPYLMGVGMIYDSSLAE